MRETDVHHKNGEYLRNELAEILPVLSKLGFELEEKQPHLLGERFVMRAITTKAGKKLILIGRSRSDNMRVVIKVASDREGADELEHERVCRRVLGNIRFAYQIFHSPREIVFVKDGPLTISVQQFLEQECTFLERTLQEQFKLALKAFKAQESAHATTYAHYQLATRTFGSRAGAEYIKNFESFRSKIANELGSDHASTALLKTCGELLNEHRDTIEQYAGFLTHTDFVPHNIRIQKNDIYLLDHSSIVFGNKYEGWARFINFMTLYNPPLESALLQYVRENRASEETLSLKLMRIYRLGEIVWFYVDASTKTSGDLRALELRRVEFWCDVLRCVLEDIPLSDKVREAYKRDRDNLRSSDEKERQVGLH